MRFIKPIAFLFAILPSFTSFAGEATIIGKGRVSADPDYVSLTLRVTSECYSTPAEASRANDAKVSDLTEYLQAFVNMGEDSRDDILANGGYTQPFSRTLYPDGLDSFVVCEGTFQKTTTVILKSTNVSSFGSVLTGIQEYVFADFQPRKSKNDGPVTFVSIYQPSPELFHETRNRKESEALLLAKSDAINKFETLIHGSCEINYYQIVEIGEPDESVHEMPYASKSSALGSGEAASVPVFFDAHWVKRAVKIKFYYEGGRCSENFWDNGSLMKSKK